VVLARSEARTAVVIAMLLEEVRSNRRSPGVKVWFKVWSRM